MDWPPTIWRELMQQKMQRKQTMTFGVAVLLATLAATPLLAQTQPAQSDPMITAVKMGASVVRLSLTKAAAQMSEEDYAFKATPDVRSFGQILAHVADNNYMNCAVVKGEAPPVRDVEKTRKTRADIQRALSESFAYCDGAYAVMTDDKAKAMINLGGMQMPTLALLMYLTAHHSLHYGNVITYMRLRGQVPSSMQPPPQK